MAKRITKKAKAAVLTSLGVKPNSAPQKRGTGVKAKRWVHVDTWVDVLQKEKQWTNPRTPSASERKKVKVLSVRADKCTPSEVAKLTNLEYVRLACYDDALLAPFVEVFRDLEKLVWLSISGLTDALVPELGELEKLRRFELRCQGLSHEGVKVLPDELFGMANLEQLEIHECRITTLPDSVGTLKKLERIMLWQNPNLARLPSAFGTLPELATIDLVAPHALDDAQAFGVLAKLPKLERLRISSRGAPLPRVLGRFPALVSLSAAHFSAVPASIARCTTLRSLDLGWCEDLATLPPEIAKLPALRHLNLYANNSLDFTQAAAVIAKCEYLVSITLPAGGLPAVVYETLRAGGFMQTPNMYGDRWIRGDAVV
ncbi:MAG: leucine-rich repeat domain-containing protein [Kofleriaceae bacterium]